MVDTSVPQQRLRSTPIEVAPEPRYCKPVEPYKTPLHTLLAQMVLNEASRIANGGASCVLTVGPCSGAPLASRATCALPLGATSGIASQDARPPLRAPV